MQVFIDPANLTSTTGYVTVYAFYDDHLLIDESLHPGKTMMTVPNSSVTVDPNNNLMQMDQTWRQDAVACAALVDAEANLRIQVAFPDDMQRKANATINSYILSYGTTVSGWPQSAQDAKTEMDKGWSYINSVNQSATALKGAALPLDPTDDSYWPPVIPPVSF